MLTGVPLQYLINVRMIRVQETDEMVMDTLGLSTFQLPDAQCRSRGFHTNAMAGMVFSLCANLFESGDVIGDGQTIDGIDGRRWKCTHEHSLLGPAREVLAVHPPSKQRFRFPRRA
jgi:hypothetical protein